MKVEESRTIIIIVLTTLMLGLIGIYAIRPISHKQIISSPQQSFSNSPKIVSGEQPLMTDIQLTEYNAGNRSFTVSAKKMYLHNKKIKPFGFGVTLGKSREIEGVEATFYKENRPIAYLNSKYGIIDMETKGIIFKGRPCLVSEDKRTLNAEEIVWNNGERRLLAKGRCLLGAEGENWTTDFINTDVELRDFTIGGKK